VANLTSPSRRSGSPTRRTLNAAARAAAKRAERAERSDETAGNEAKEPRRAEGHKSGRTVLIERPDGWDDPPEPRPDSAEDDVLLPRPGRGRGLLTALLALLLVAGVVAVAVLGWQYREGRATEQARKQALAAARAAAPVVLSYDHRHLDRDFARAHDLLTGKFRDEYGRTTKAVVGPTARKYDGVVKATVVEPPGGGAPAAAVVSASPDRVVVLLFVNQITESTQVTGSRVDLNRVRMTMSRTSEGWKVSAVDAL
jgi:Mce-associated membrane protein